MGSWNPVAKMYKDTDETRTAHVTTTSRDDDFVRTYYAKVKTTLTPMSHEAPGQFTGPVRPKTWEPVGNHRACRADPQDFSKNFGSVKLR